MITKEMLKSDLNNAYITVGKQSREIERQADVIKELEDHVRELESGACSCCAEDWKNKKIVKLNEEKIELKAQIEKMKNRCNCKNGWYSTIGRAGFGCNLNIIKCAGCKHWEMKE